MSGAGIACCRICGGSLYTESDYLDHTLAERTETCEKCGLYHYEYSYGNSRERVGVIVSEWGPGTSPPANWRDQETEAKFLLRSEDAQAFLRAMQAEPELSTPRLVFADWLDDHDCPLSAAYLRSV